MAGKRLNGKVALITGAAQGIGAAHARIFALEGAKVVIGDISLPSLQGVADEIRTEGGIVEAIELDVTSRTDWKNAVDRCCSSFGGLTTLVNNAGIYYPVGLEDETQEGWDKIIQTNQTSIFLAMQECIPVLKKCGNASIINILSLLGLIGTYKCFSYHAAKSAVKMMSKSASLELAAFNIRVNSIYPGSISTPIIENMSPVEREDTAKTIPLGRWGHPDDVAYASLFLCSDEASYITGAQISVDGGYYPGG